MLRVLAMVLLCFVVVVSFSELRNDVLYAEYYSLADNVAKGRFNVADAEAVKPLLEQPLQDRIFCSYTQRRLRAILSLYRADLLLARQENRPGPIEQGTELWFAVQDAIKEVVQVLDCAPRDGDMWLRLAQLLHLSDESHLLTEFALERSYEVTPHESWISTRRVAFEQYRSGQKY